MPPTPQLGHLVQELVVHMVKEEVQEVQQTRRNLVHTRPKPQPPGDGLKTAKHHLNPDANPAKNPPPQGGEVTSLKPIKEKKQAPARGQKTRRNLVQTRPKQQPPGDGLKTAKHHLNPDANPAKNPPPQGGEVTSLKPIKEKKQAPARGQKTRRNLVQTRPKQQPPGDGLKTAKHHLNPDANPAKNPPPQGGEVTSLKPLKEKKQAPARGQKTQRNLVQTRPKQQPPGDGLKTAKHHLNPDANLAKNPSPAGWRSDKSETPKGEETGPSTWTENATQPSPDTPKTATSRRWTQNSQTPPKSGRKPSKKPSPAGWRSDKSETHKGEETGPSTWTENATQPSPDTPKTATSPRWTQNSQTPPKSGRKPSKKPFPAGWRSDKSETPKGEETGPSTWTENATQPSPDTPKTATSLKTAKHHLNPDANPAKNPSPQGGEVTSLKPLKEKKQAPARGQKTRRNLVQTRPKQQPPGDGLKTAKHHLNPDANPAKNPSPQGGEVTSLKPLKEKKQAPARAHKTQRNLAQTRPKQQPPGDGFKTAKHHLNPDANPAKNPPPQGGEVTSLKPLKEKKQAPARGQKTQRNLVQTRPKQQPPGHGLKTAKHHLNPDANPAKNPPPQGGEVTSLKPLKEKKQAPARAHKTQRNLAQTRPKQQPPGDGLKTAKHHLNPDANPAKNPPPQGGEVTSLKPIKEKKQAPARGQKTQRNLVQTRPKPQPAPLRTQKTSRSLPRTTPRPQLLHNGSPTVKHHCFSTITHKCKPTCRLRHSFRLPLEKGEGSADIYTYIYIYHLSL